MSRYFLFIIFSVFVFFPRILSGQQLVYETQKSLDYYFDKSDSQNDSIFTLLGEKLSSAAYFKYLLTVKIEVYKSGNNYSVSLKAIRDNVECRYRYRGFLMSDFLVADNINIKGELTASAKQLLVFNMQDTEIPSSFVVFDTTFTDELDLDYFYFTISEIQLFMKEKSLSSLKQGQKKIDNYFRFDSLYAAWLVGMDAMEMSNVDRIPVYQFQLNDMEQELKQYDKNEYEVLLSRSQMDNTEYLRKRSVLYNRIAELKLDLSKKISVMDELMFEKGKQFEDEHDLQKAIYYYNRALDYNPSHCEALEKLSDLYIQNNLHQQNLELFTDLKVRGDNISCESTLTNSVCDSMCMKATHMISQRNYYDAIKFLDTLELLFYQMPDTSYMQRYYNLKKQAQEGIYDSYLEVIGRAIKNNKLELGKEYIYGLTDIMRKDDNNPTESQKYIQMIERFLVRHADNIRSSLRRRNYATVISDNDAMIFFLDSIAYSYNKEMFKDAYTTSHTALYLEKKRYSEQEALDYLKKHTEYISVASGQEMTSLHENVFTEDNTKSKYDFLAQYILSWNESMQDFSVVDSLLLFFQLDERDDIYDTLVFAKAARIVSETISKINQYAWSNELLHATELTNKVDNVVSYLNLQQTNPSLFEKFNQTKDLLYHRFAQQAESEYNNLVAKTEKLTSEKEYLQAYDLLKRGEIILRQSVFQPQIKRLMENVSLPAEFQQKMFTVEQNLALGDYIHGFIFYEDAYNYFHENEIAQYSLSCDSLIVLVKKRKQNDFLKSAVIFFMGNNEYDNAMDVMMYAIDLGYKMEDVQSQLGAKLKSISYDYSLLTEKYTFTKVHTPFLKSFFGKPKAFWHNVKQWKIFNLRKKAEQ